MSIRNGGTLTLADLFRERRQVERGIAEAAEEPAEQTLQERGWILLWLLRVFRMKGKNACLARGARHILRRNCSLRHRFGYPL